MIRKIACIPLLALLIACDFMSPVESTPVPNEYEYNYWLLQKTYLYQDELAALPEEGDSVQQLYSLLKDKYTRYTEPSRSEAVIESRNTSIITGDIGVEFWFYTGEEYPLYIRHVFPEGPADRAGVKKGGNVISINGTDLDGESAYSTYSAVFNLNSEITLEIRYEDTTVTHTMKRETIYAPTIFVDTTLGYEVINIREFKPNTYDRENGTYGELQRHLDSTAGSKSVRILDLRNNPGGHVDQCIRMADLFVKSGTLSTRRWFVFSPDGKRTEYSTSVEATQGDPGEAGKFVLLANSGSASCAEIFVAAVHELTDFPLAGMTTFGKGIGQSSWSTIDGGLATITTLEFRTPRGNSYHGEGLKPDFACADGATIQCAIEAAEKRYGKSLKKIGARDAENRRIPVISRKPLPHEGGAFLENYLF